MPPLKSKTRFVNFIIIVSSVFFLFLLISRILCRENFSKLPFIDFIQKLQPRHHWILVIALFFIYAGSGIAIGFARHQALETRAFDMGIFDQALWTTLHGSFLFSSIKDNICLLGDHFSPLLILLTPWYALWQDPRMLLILQSLVLASCIPAIYKTAFWKTGDSQASLCFAVAFFLFYPEKSSLHEDFHPEVLIQPLIFLAFALLISKKNGIFLAVLTLILSAKESMAGIAFGFGFYTFLFEKRRLFGLLLMMFAVFYIVFTTQWVIPQLSGSPYLYRGFYGSIFSQPELVFYRLLSVESFTYVLKLFSPLLFLSFLHFPTLTLTLPILLQNLLSNNPVNRSFSYHYTVGLSPFVFISAIYGWQILTRREWAKKYGRWLLAVMVFVSVIRSGPSEYYYFWNSLKNSSTEKNALRKALESIPPSAVVLTHNNIIAQISRRKFIYQFEHNASPTKTEQIKQIKPDTLVLAVDFWEPGTLPPEDLYPVLEQMGYEIQYDHGGFSVLTRKDRQVSDG